MADRGTAMASIWKMDNSNMLLAPESPNIRRDVERNNSEPPDASPPMENSRRRGSNSRLPSLATLVRKSISFFLYMYNFVIASERFRKAHVSD